MSYRLKSRRYGFVERFYGHKPQLWKQAEISWRKKVASLTKNKKGETLQGTESSVSNAARLSFEREITQTAFLKKKKKALKQ